MDSRSLFSLQEMTIENTLGAVFLGLIGAAFLFGISTLQVCWYYHSYPQDLWMHKFSVGVLWTLDALHLSVITHAVYTYAVRGFGDLAGLETIIWSIKLQVLLNVIVVLMVHSLYAIRVWRLGGYHRGFLGYLVAFTVAGGSVIGIVVACRIFSLDSYNNLDHISWLIIAAFATATSIDFMIATAMCYYLRKSQGSITRLHSRISTVMQYTLSTGLLTSACSLAAIFTYILLPNTSVFIGIEFLLTKLYVVSFFTMLNARKREDSETLPSSVTVGITSSFWGSRPQETMHTHSLPASSWSNIDGAYPQPTAF
ncbi:hypothetical protein BDQ17DRAFT_1366874 [Cyathus striatus]|nr:hypothetical protein BDQ17DRAFT_1366874 [Cyathus striatus]